MANNRRRSINSKNPNNPRSELFKSLTRIFSGPLVNRRSQTGRRLKRSSLDKFASRFQSTSGQEFKKSRFHPLAHMQSGIISSHNRTDRYVDFDQMEYTPEIASALDIYSDEMTTHSGLEPMLSVKCSNEEIKAILSSLYHDIMNVQVWRLFLICGYRRRCGHQKCNWATLSRIGKIRSRGPNKSRICTVSVEQWRLNFRKLASGSL